MKNKLIIITAAIGALLLTGCRNNGDFIDTAARKYDAGVKLTDYEYINEDQYELTGTGITEKMFDKLTKTFTGTKFEKYLSINREVMYSYFTLDLTRYASDILADKGYEFEVVEVKGFEEYMENHYMTQTAYKKTQIDNIICYIDADGKIVKDEYFVMLSKDNECYTALRANNLEGLIQWIENADFGAARSERISCGGFGVRMYGGYFSIGGNLEYSEAGDGIREEAQYLSDMYELDAWAYIGNSCVNEACEYVEYIMDIPDYFYTMKVFGKDKKVKELVISYDSTYIDKSAESLIPEYGDATLLKLLKSMGATEEEITELLDKNITESGEAGSLKYKVSSRTIKIFR